jgi:hypothetical protein
MKLETNLHYFIKPVQKPAISSTAGYQYCGAANNSRHAESSPLVCPVTDICVTRISSLFALMNIVPAKFGIHGPRV